MAQNNESVNSPVQTMPNRIPDHPLAGLDQAAVLRDVLGKTAATTGHPFFCSLVESLSRSLNVHTVWVTEYIEEDDSLNALALVSGQELKTNYRYPLDGTPCEPVIRGAVLVHHADNVQEIYPRDTDLKELDARSYVGIPVLDTDGLILGHLAVLDKQPMPEEPAGLAVFQMFASRAAAELQRIRAEKEQEKLRHRLEQANEALNASEQRLRDLFEEAPIAYVHEGLDSRFISANRAALRILGVRPEEVEGTYGRSLVPDTPDAQKRVEDALASVGHGKNTSDVILELRRKDDGQPIWVRWWSSPAPDGSFTRTMFIDVTQQVLSDRKNRVLQAHNSYLQEELRNVHPSGFIGECQKMRLVFEDIKQVAPTNATVLVLGETGTGKELAARAVHTSSSRSDKPFIKVNCAALPASLIEAELFGHEKGAFTGATKERAGRFELADGATIFLDEIAEIPIDLQVKLLRVLQEGEFERVGSSKTRSVDVRVVAATNRDLLEAVHNGEFREDLYYRLAVFPLEMPPLRERGDDIVRLATEFCSRYAQSIGKTITPLCERDARRLGKYAWPGNVRELQNVVERAVITSTDGVLNLNRALPESTDDGFAQEPTSTPRVRTADEIQEIERNNIFLALQSSGWRVAGKNGAASLLGVHASTLSSRMKSLGIKRPGQAG